MTRADTVALTTVLLVVACACAVPEEGAGRRFGSIGTAGTGGIYYPLGGVLARMLSERVEGMRFTAEVTGGSVENLNRVASGDIDLGMAIGTTLAKAMEGPEATRYDSLRIVAPLYPNLAHLLVARGSGIESLRQIAGKRVSVGAAGSGTEQMSRDLLSVLGLALNDIKPRYLSFSESSAALRDGSIDAAMLSVGYPAAAVLEATTASNVRLIGLESGQLEMLIRRFPYYAPATLPAGAYPGVHTELPTVSMMNWIFATVDLEAEIATAVLESLSEGLEQLQQVNQIAAQIDLGALSRAPLPLHPATAAWLEQH